MHSALKLSPSPPSRSSTMSKATTLAPSSPRSILSNSRSMPNLAHLEQQFHAAAIAAAGSTLPLPNVSLTLNISAPPSLSSSPATSSSSSTSSSALSSSVVIGNPQAISPPPLERPRTLPPKSTAELQKHKKEYEEIEKSMKKAMMKELKEKERREQAKQEREKKLMEYKKIWVEDVIPNWESRKGTKKVQEMRWMGIPTSLRPTIWKLCTPNDLRVTQELYDISLQHAKQTKEALTANSKSDNFSSELLVGKEVTVYLVDLEDVPKYLPCRSLFVPGGPMREPLIDVLEAYSSYRPDVGYVPGMSFLGAMLLLNLNTLDTFICLANLINQPFLMSFYITDRNEMLKYTQAMDSIVEALLPKVHKHFQDIGIAPEQYMVDWFRTLYSQVLSIDLASRVWDIYLAEGELLLYRVALAILKMYSHQFESFPRDLCMNLLTHLPEDTNEDEFFENIQYFVLDPKKFQKILQNPDEK